MTQKQIAFFYALCLKIQNYPLGGIRMKKNIKRFLSYALGVILAMGLGLSYAYAVGANDSNAFVTTTEWETKVAQIEASLDNVTKTINDTNMDFMLNGPRLQASLVEGWENGGVPNDHTQQIRSTGIPHYQDMTHTINIQPVYNELMLVDTYDGQQRLNKIPWPTSTQNYTMYALRERMAFKTNTTDVYVVVSVFGTASVFFGYVYTGTYPIYPSSANIPAKTLTFSLPRDRWYHYNYGNSNINPMSRTNSYVYCAYNSGFGSNYCLNSHETTAASNDGFDKTGAYITKTVDENNITYTLEFPAQCNSIRYVAANSAAWDMVPIFMGRENRKFATVGNSVAGAICSTEGFSCAKVYSPQKGSLCLKSFIHGEVPILNE